MTIGEMLAAQVRGDARASTDQQLANAIHSKLSESGASVSVSVGDVRGDSPPAGFVRLFVYGLLKRGFILGAMIESEGAEFVREAVLDGYTIHDAGIAFMFAYPGGHVHGEVWDVPVALMPKIDRIESGYRRTSVTLRDQGNADAYVARGFVGDLPGTSSWPSPEIACRSYRSRFLSPEETLKDASKYRDLNTWRPSR